MKRSYSTAFPAFPSMATPLHDAARNASLRAVIALIEDGADVNVRDAQGRIPLYYACVRSNYDVCKALIDAGSDVESIGEDGRSILHMCACRAYSPNLINLLVDAGADPNIPDSGYVTPLTYAVMQQCKTSAHKLVRRGADIYVPAAGSYSPHHILSKVSLTPSFQTDIVKKATNELWIMSSDEYDSRIQWLPKEMVEDVLGMVKSNWDDIWAPKK